MILVLTADEKKGRKNRRLIKCTEKSKSNRRNRVKSRRGFQKIRERYENKKSKARRL